MSMHESERLSAYLDDALTADEQRSVESHLAACDECAALLERLALVDTAVAGLPAAEPSGEDRSFAARVRGRIERERPRRARRLEWAPLRLRLPAWTWAAAAAVLLAVITPLTLRMRREALPAERSPRRDLAAPAAAPVDKDATAKQKSTEARAERSARLSPPPRTAPLPAPVAADRLSARDEAAPAAPFAETSGPAAKAGPTTRGMSAAPAPPTEATAGGRASDASQKDDRFAGLEGGVPGGVVGGVAGVAKAQDREARTAADQPAAPAAASRVLEAHPGKRNAQLAEEKRLPESSAVAFRRLASQRPRTTEEWRTQRDAWQVFVVDHPGGPEADEARVRGLEASYELWRASGDERERAGLEHEARAYLARRDARQQERVRRLLDQRDR